MNKMVKDKDFNLFTDLGIERLIARATRLLRGEASPSYGPTAGTFGNTWLTEVEHLVGPENAPLLFNLNSGRRSHREPELMQFIIACLVAEKAHEGIPQKSNSRRYVDHPRYVAYQFSDYKDKQVAILHDVLEGSNIKPEHLQRMGFDQDVIDDVVRLTRPREPVEMAYLDYIRNVGMSLRAGRIKIEDIKHNLQPDRAIPRKGITPEKFILKQEAYHIALPYLQAIQDKKIAAGTSVIEFLTTEPCDFLIGDNKAPVSEWPQQEVTAKAEHLYMMRQALLRMSEQEAKNIAIFDGIINQMISEDRLPAPRRPRTVSLKSTEHPHHEETVETDKPEITATAATPFIPGVSDTPIPGM